ncbi:MAG TPA: ABA4-like family protein [Allosphingosinicella sp.]
MLDPHFAFSSAGMLAMLGWLALLVSLFVAPARPAAWMLARWIVPGLIGLAYMLLFWSSWGNTPGGGFGSVGEVRALFANDHALAAGWLHYLAFDLFVGSWIAELGLKARIPALLLIPCLALTFLLGPTGLVLFLLLRLAFARRAKPAESAQ